MMPKISVVIPLYNKQNYIENTLKSVLSQRFTDFEIVLINDCSTDDSWAIAAKVIDDRIVRIEHSKNKGLSASRNTGIKASTSQYIAFLDADDTWDPDYLSTMDGLITDFPQASLFASTYRLVLDNGKTVVHGIGFLQFDKRGVLENFFTSNLNEHIYYPSCLTVHRKVFDAIGNYNENIQYSEDIDFNIRAHAQFSMAFTKEPLVTYYVDSENQITQSPLGSKTIPDFDHYEQLFKGRLDIKKYLDFQRYVLAKKFKLDGDLDRSNRLKKGISMNNITWKQRLLLNLPLPLLKLVGRTKLNLQRKGITVSSSK